MISFAGTVDGIASRIEKLLLVIEKGGPVLNYVGTLD
jgi:hypothetical protein